MQKILLISALGVWSMGKNKGAGSFYKTIEGFAKLGKVDFICHGKQIGLPKNVHCYAINTPFLDRLIGISLIKYIAYPIWWIIFNRKAKQISRKIIANSRPDIIYAYEIQSVPVSKNLSTKYNIPLVTRFQGTKLELDKIENWLYQIKYFDHILALKASADLIIMTNDGTQGEKILKKLGNKSKIIKFWLNGVEKPEDFLPMHIKRVRNQLGLQSQQKMMLMVSRLVGWKRVDRMISALPNIRGDYKLFIAGDGPEKFNLEKKVIELGKSDQVEFLGAVKQEKIDKLMSVADIFVSLYDLSNVGNPLLQAMSYGKAIVTLNNGDTKQFIDNTRGVLLPSDKPDKLAESINKLLSDSKTRHWLGANAKKYAQENIWSWDERINAETKEVEKLISN